ncbi:MAG: hypothetical protein J6X33_08210 [Clostridiales bacterium]|nr:hypothetical protein [Clostridiales bacterium]
MSTGFENQELIAKLPQSGVHCYPASGSKITRNRVVSLIVFLISAGLGGFLLTRGSVDAPTPFLFAGLLFIVAIIMILVFCQTFLSAKYRVAVDYNDKKIYLRYRYSRIAIPFENFDGRKGTPDKAERMLDNVAGGSNEYLILDDVFEDACFQTSAKDLASREDFEQLKADCFAIAEAYGARNSEDKVKFYYEKDDKKAASSDDIDVDDIVESAMSDAKDVTEKAEDAAADAAEDAASDEGEEN